MKAEERRLARQLRRKGCSVREISERVGCSKSSVSRWVNDIPLTSQQIDKLKSRQDRGRAKAANHPNSPKHVWAKIRRGISEAACLEIPPVYSTKNLRMIGSALYWAEGARTRTHTVLFGNSDPDMIRLMMQFFREVCAVPLSKFRGRVQIHSHLNRKGAELFWSKTSGIPLHQFHRAQVAISRASQQKRDKLPLGTFRIFIGDVRVFSKIVGWTNGMRQWTHPGNGRLAQSVRALPLHGRGRRFEPSTA